MTEQVKAWGAQAPDADLAPLTIERRTLRDDDVEIEISHCGVCHSDLHTARNDWGWSTYPIVPGHEIIGTVTRTGAKVTRVKAGDAAGVGCMVDSCMDCHACDEGLEQYCEHGHIGTYGMIDPKDGQKTQGGYSEKIVVNEKFVLRVPEGLDRAGAAPLLCAGITVYSPLRHWKIGKGSRVAVVGLGGLGHMAIKLASAMGAEVALFTRSPEKSDDARALGASRIIVSTDEAQMQAAVNQFDVIIDTVPYQHDLKPYIPTLALNGTLVLVGLVGDIEPTVNTVPLILGRRAIAGSVIGGIAETQEMLDFCAQHGITADIEMINMQDINDAYVRMLKSDVKYRFVIDMQSLRESA